MAVLIFVSLLMLMLFPAYSTADRTGFVNTIVIDAGHGGRDPGAVGSKIKEKDVVLALALKVGELIKTNLPDVRVVYTRTTDTFVELHRRARIANENNADLFVSIHLNSVRSSSPFGTETFVMGLHRSEANLEVARQENAAILFEENFEAEYDGYDPNSPESSIIFSLFQNVYLNQSLLAASLIQDQFREHARRVDRGVKQAGFLVLYRVTAPAILVEAGFISNPAEQEFLASTNGQRLIAQSIFNGIAEYKRQQDLLATNFTNNAQASVARPTTPASTPERNVGNQPTSAAVTQVEVPTANAGTTSLPEVTFKVQFATSPTQRPINAPEWRALQQIEMYFHQGIYKYTSGVFSTLQQAIAHQAVVRNAGFRDAFVVAFKNNERISIENAQRRLQQLQKR